MKLRIHLEPRTMAALEEIARRQGTTVPQLVDRAVQDLIEREGTGNDFQVDDLVGCVDCGPSDLSIQTGRKFLELLKGRASVPRGNSGRELKRAGSGERD